MANKFQAIKPFRFNPTIKRDDFNYEFVDYTWFKNFLSPEECDSVRSLWNASQVQEAMVSNSEIKDKKEDLRKSSINFLKPGVNDWLYDRLAQACIQVNSNRFKFEIKGFQTELQLARYEDGGFFDWHMDFGSGDISNRKLSITVQLSDPDEYEGGNLQFMVNQNTIDAPREKGTAIIFPSFFPHRVMPVTKGCRMSVVGWIGGPPYR
jgi:PKHD-type hydroxylase